MPRLSPNANIAMGIAGVQGSINGQLIPDSTGPYWVNPELTVFVQPSSNQLVYFHPLTNERSPAYSAAINQIAAGGNVWAVWIDAVHGLVASTGYANQKNGLLDVGPDGSIGYTVDRQNDIHGCEAINLNGEVWRLSDNPIAQLQLLGQNRAIYKDYNFNLVSIGVPQIVRVPGNFWNPCAVELNGEWWISYFSELYGYILHPFNSTVGYVIQPNSAPVFQPQAVSINGVIRCCWSVTQGEGPGDYRIDDVNTSRPRQEIVAAIEIPAVGKPCWLTWFEFNRAPDIYPPGNGIIKIRWDIPNSIISKEWNRIGTWIEGHSVPEINEKVKNEAYQALAYWDSRSWPEWPVLRPGDWIAQQVYCGANEPINEFEVNMQREIDKVPSQFAQIALVCQCYTSNADLTSNLAGLIPVFARLARNNPRVNMLAIFSDQDRATGLNDHPELRPLYQELLNGITGEPDMSNDPDILPENIYKTLQEIRHKWPTPMGNRAAEMLNEAAWIHRAEGWGLESKSGGNVCPQPQTGTTCGCDILRLQESGYDCLQDAEGIAEPYRGARGDADPNRYVTAVEPEVIPPPTNDVYIGILDYDKVVSRANPNGMLIRFDCGSADPIVQIDLELLNDGEPSIPIHFLDEPRRDGRYCRALAFKPTVNGHWTLRVTATNNKGVSNFADGPVQVEVTF